MATCNQLLVLLAISVSVGLLPWTVSAQGDACATAVDVKLTYMYLKRIHILYMECLRTIDHEYRL